MSPGVEIALSICSDGLGHVFAVGDDGIADRPVCGADVAAVRGFDDDDDSDACQICFDATLSWAKKVDGGGFT